MKQKESSIKRHPYLPPRAEIIGMETQGVLCGSAINGNNNTEGVGISDFGWI